MQLALDPCAPWAGFTAWFSGHAAASPALTTGTPARSARQAPGPALRQLAAGSQLLLERAQGVELLCLQGTLWVSQGDEEAEHIVVPGRPFVARDAGTLQVHAISDSHCLLIAPQA
jgi:hypothetical protein